MCEDEENLIRGQIVSDYLNAKQRLIALYEKANGIADLFDRLKMVFSRRAFVPESLEKDLVKLPGAEQLRNLLSEIEETERKKKDAENALRGLGIEIKSEQ